MDNNDTKTKPTDKKGNQQNEPQIPFGKLFTYASNKDKLFMFLGVIGAIAQGACMPLSALLMGDVADSFAPGNGGDVIVDAASNIAWKFALIGCVGLVCAYVAFASWMIIGEKQTVEIRKHYFRSLLRQEIAFYDSINPNELSTKISEECFNIQQAITEKIPTFASSMSTLLTGFVIGYVKGWQLALVMSAFLPIMSITGGIFVMSMQKLSKMNNDAFGQAGAISEEVLNAIRTVVSLGGQNKESKRYQRVLEENKKPIMKFAVTSGVTLGIMFFGMIGIYALGFLVGSIFVENRVTNPVADLPYSAGDILTIFFSIIIGSFSPMKAAPCMKAFAIAKVSGAKAFAIIDRKSKISIEDPSGLKPSSIEGNIQFRNVSFAYPLKLERTILDGISFDIRKNEKTALVGESGCGKTTCMQLIERFYDIEEGNGSITLDGNELKSLNLKWMRENIGYVGQEPVLFATSIKENLRMVKIEATDDEIWDALKKANAADFVEHLPDKLDTFVGSNGTQLSGGQKQRLAIARAILKNPRILLLDEATSALDRKNEMEIQKTLDEISEGRTTIVIAHRLSTIRNADHIIMFEKGKVVEEGTHEQLIALKGKYYTLQHIQLQTEEKDKGAEENNIQENNKDKNQMQPIKQASHKNLKGNNKVHPDQKLEVTVHNGKETQSLTNNSKTTDYEIYKRLFSYNKSDIHLIGFAVIAAIVHGCIMPLISIILSNMIEVLALPDASDYRKRANLFCLYFLICAIVDSIAMTVSFSCCNVVAERLSRRVRAEVFNKYLKMPIGWFDEPENSPGALGSKLSTDATMINTLTSSAFIVYFEAASNFTTGMIIAFTASWQLTLVGLALSPLQIISGAIRSKFSQTFRAGSDEAYQGSVAFASEAINNMRTVASFGKEEELLKSYSDKLEGPLQKSRKNGNLSGLAVGGGDLVSNFVNAIIFYLGAVFIRDINLGFKDMFQSIMGIMFASIGIGNALSAAPDIGAGKNAALNIFKILDTKPAIDIDDPHQTVRKLIQGDIEFRNVWFKYPSREKQIFKGLNLKINASNKVALVGPSGCGKSTILALLQRFYDVDQGEILIDGVNIKEYDLRHLRSCYGVVSQEPVLFNGTIEYNIKYSKENATEEEMRQAATKASAIGFIESNQFDVIGDANEAASKYGTGFKRKVGPKGGQLSGGQKQRIAIARAIMKDPSVLILDEATSALDAQNEKIVQASLDNIMKGKTSVIVAHRISTIKDADDIIVFYDGEIKERGNYQQLTEKQGIFYKLERGLNL